MTDAQFTALIAATLLSNSEYTDYTRLDAIEEAEALIKLAKDRIYVEAVREIEKAKAEADREAAEEDAQIRQEAEEEALAQLEEEEIKDQEARAASHAAMMAEGDRIV